MAEDINKELLKLKVKIGNSFLRAFYPIDYRSSQNILKNIDELLNREATGLRTLASTTSQVNTKIGRILTGINADLDQMQRALDGLETTVMGADDILGDRINQLESSTASLLDFLGAAGGYEAIRRLREARNKGRGPKGGPPSPTQPGEDGEGKKGKGKDKGKYKLPKGMGIIGLAWGLWTLWDEIQSVDTNLSREEYRKEITKVVAKAVGSIGLMWAGAFLGAMVGGAIGFGVGAIPGFIAGLLGGMVADYTLGDSVDQIAEGVVDYLYPSEEEEKEEAPAEGEGPPPLSDSTIQQREESQALQLQTPEQQVSEQASDVQALVAPPIPGPVPPAPPMEQSIDGPVEYPGPVAPVDLAPFAPGADESSRAKIAVNEAANRANTIVNQAASSNATIAEQLYGGGQQSPQTPYALQSDTSATISTSQNLAGSTDGGLSLGRISTSTGLSTEVNAMLVPNFQGFVNALESTGYRIKSIGGYVDRNINGKNKKSFHASGAAIDINPGENPHLHGGAMQTDMPQNVATIAKQFGLGWGGSWSSSKDTMHFSAASSEGGDFKVDRNTGEITPLAEGGKVSKPTLALIGEAGEPEYVVPQSKAIKFAHEMVAARPTYRTKKHTHLLVVPIMT